MGVAAISIDLDRAVKAREDLGRIFTLSAGSVVEHHPRRRGAVPAAVVAQYGQKVNQ